MAAIDSKNKLELLSIYQQKGISKKTGNPYEINKGQFVIHTPNGVRIGAMSMRNELLNTKPGSYLAEFELNIDFDNNIVPIICGLHPIDAKTLTPAAAASVK